MARNPALISAHRITFVPSAGLWRVRKTCKFPISNFRTVTGWGYTQQEAWRNWEESHKAMLVRYSEAHKVTYTPVRVTKTVSKTPAKKTERLGEAGAVQHFLAKLASISQDTHSSLKAKKPKPSLTIQLTLEC